MLSAMGSILEEAKAATQLLNGDTQRHEPLTDPKHTVVSGISLGSIYQPFQEGL